MFIPGNDPQFTRALHVALAAATAPGAEAHPDIVLLDLGMPHLDGVQVIHALRGWTTVPIIVV